MKELILVCLKCGHHLCVGGWNTEKKMKEIMKMDCPECGEESGELWIISRFGDYEMCIRDRLKRRPRIFFLAPKTSTLT